jgi:AcrR family transcriptional regulator
VRDTLTPTRSTPKTKATASVRAQAGRKRSFESQAAILEAALAVLERRGLAAASIEAIAAEAGVGKQTIYRWWPTRGAIFLEALRTHAELETRQIDTGVLLLDLQQFLAATFSLLKGRYGPVVAALMAEAQLNREFHDLFRLELIDKRRESLRVLFEHARRRGEITSEADVDAIIDMVFGAMWYRLLIRHDSLSSHFAKTLAKHASRLATPT